MEIENLKLQKQIDELIDKIYPVGSYYETTIYSLFEGEYLLEKVDLSQLDTSNITSTSRLFYNCTNLKEVNLSTNDFSNVDTTTEMLNGVPSDCVFIVKDQTTKDWLLSIRSDLTGIQIK